MGVAEVGEMDQNPALRSPSPFTGIRRRMRSQHGRNLLLMMSTPKDRVAISSRLEGLRTTAAPFSAQAGTAPAAKGGSPIAELGWSVSDALAMRARLSHFAEGWDDPAMDAYDAI